MRILVSYFDGSQKVELDDGQVVHLSSPYSNGERKLTSESGRDLGHLTSQYPNGHKYARMKDGSEYDVSEKPHWFSGSQETWQKFKKGRSDEISPSDLQTANQSIQAENYRQEQNQSIDNKNSPQEQNQSSSDYFRESYRLYQEELLRQIEEIDKQIEDEEEEDERLRQEDEEEEDERLRQEDEEKQREITAKKRTLLHIGNLSPITTEEDLLEEFSPFESSDYCVIIKNEIFEGGKNSALIEFKDSSAAECAIKHINNTEINGSVVVVDIALNEEQESKYSENEKLEIIYNILHKDKVVYNILRNHIKNEALRKIRLFLHEENNNLNFLGFKLCKELKKYLASPTIEQYKYLEEFKITLPDNKETQNIIQILEEFQSMQNTYPENWTTKAVILENIGINIEELIKSRELVFNIHVYLSGKKP